MQLVWMLAMVTLAAGGACRISFEPLRDDASATGSDVFVDASNDAAADICETALVCESYDAALNAVTTFGDVAWLSGAGRSGGGARARATSSQAAIALYEWPSPVTTGPLHARAYVKITAGAPIRSYFVVVQLDNDEDTLGIEKVSADLYSNDRWGIAIPFASTGSLSSSTATREAWLCVELAIDISPSNGYVRVLAEGTEVIQAGPTNTLVPGGFLQLTVGASLDSNDPDVEVFIDDVVVAQQPIGC